MSSWDYRFGRGRKRNIPPVFAGALRFAVIAVPSERAQDILDRLVRAGVTAVLSFAAAQLHAPPEVTVKTVNMAMELEGLTFALTNRGTEG